MNQIQKITSQVTEQLADRETLQTLITTTFNNLSAPQVKQAMVEGMMRGFTFQDFLKKHVYAIPFKAGYSLITSVDYVRKVAMNAGLAGKKAPVYEMENGKPVSCSVTVQKRDTNGNVGDFTATVFFDEYSTGKNLWLTKPRTMLAKVAEMHALRMAFPDELKNTYIEEEQEQEQDFGSQAREAIIEGEDYITRAREAKTIDELKDIFRGLPQETRNDKTVIAKFSEIKKALV